MSLALCRRPSSHATGQVEVLEDLNPYMYISQQAGVESVDSNAAQRGEGKNPTTGIWRSLATFTPTSSIYRIVKAAYARRGRLPTIPTYNPYLYLEWKNYSFTI